MIREIFGKKLGMTQLFNPNGDVVGVSVVEVPPACILEKMGYTSKKAVKIGCFKLDKKGMGKLSKPVTGYFKKIQTESFALIREVESAQDVEIKKEIGLEIFADGEIVDVRGKIKGKGFQGGVKRYGWHGGPGGHGSMFHRRIGSNGSNTDPGRVFRGHHMPGHTGNCYRTAKNVEIIKIDKDKNILFIKGAIPGSRGTVVKIKKTKWPTS